MVLGAGRETKDSPIDFGSGIVLLKKAGQKVSSGEPVLRIYTANVQKAEEGIGIIRKAVELGNKEPEKNKTSITIIK
jgi:pyrimidine-nucleoside phosphorylase